TGGGEVNVRLRYDLPVFFHPTGVSSQLRWRAFRSGNQLVIEATNSGSRHARIQGLKLVAAQGEIPITTRLAGYVLPRSTPPRTGGAGAARPDATVDHRSAGRSCAGRERHHRCGSERQ